MSIPTAKRLETVKEYYFSTKLREVRNLIASGKPILNMAIGSPDLAPPQSVLEEIQAAIFEDGAHKYQNYQGVPEFRQAIVDFYKQKYNVALDVNNEVLPLLGSKEGIMHISMAYLNEGDKVLIPNPGYPTYTSVSRLIGAEPIYYELDASREWQPDFEALEQLDLTKVKLMWVNYPHMPTGAKATKELFEELIKFGKKHHILIVNDNPYSFVLNDSPQSLLETEGAMEVALELNSLSKTFNMAGWRVGMVTGASDKIRAVLKVKSNMDSGMFLGIQKGAIAALRIEESWYDRMNAIYQERRTMLWELAKALGCTFDKKATGMFIWAKLPEGKIAEDVVDELLYQHNIFIAPGTIFGDKGKGYIRFSLCVPLEQIKEAMQRLQITV